MKFKKLIIFILIIFLLALLSIYYPELTGEVVSEPEIEYELEPAFVTRVIDGDTVETDIGEIRLLGINTPERGKAYYQEAKDFLKQIENQSVEVLRDKEDEDKYSRKLRYVFYNNMLINTEILQQGLGTSFMIEDLNDKYKNKLVSAEEFARKQGIILWEKSSHECALCIELVELNSEEEFFVLKNICSLDCNLDGWSVKDNANHFFKLNDLHTGEEERYNSKGNIWNNDGDRFFMRDDEGNLVIFWEY